LIQQHPTSEFIHPKSKIPMPRRQLPFFENVTIIDAGAEGKAVARVNDLVVFVPFCVPGDVVDIQVISKRKS